MDSSRHFTNTGCEFYPCHGLQEQNCLFCYCPLYFLDCGGTFTLTNGLKDCSACLKAHDQGSWDYIQAGLRSIRPAQLEE